MIVHQSWNSKGNYNYNAYTYVNRGWVSHFHKNFELIYVWEGNLLLTVNGKSEKMCAEDYALVLPNQIHSFDNISDSKAWVAVFSKQFVPHFANLIENSEGDTSIFKCDSSVNEFIKENLIRNESTITMKKACFYAVCDQFIKKVSLHERKGRNDDLICKIIDHIELHFTEDITLSSVAESFGYEYHYLSRILNQKYNINFSELVNEHRVDHAIDLLESGEKNITSIAMESGFQSIRNFNHVFKNITGKSPIDYLKTNN